MRRLWILRPRKLLASFLWNIWKKTKVPNTEETKKEQEKIYETRK